MIERAMHIAMNAHEGQFRKNSIEPYFSHCMSVMKILINIGVKDVDMLCAALLHDTKEDKSITDDKIVENTNERVLKLVNELTFIGTDKIAYIESFKNKSTEALIIKLIDRYCNVYDLLSNDSTYEYAKKYAQKAFPLIDLYYEDEIINQMFYICDIVKLDEYVKFIEITGTI